MSRIPQRLAALGLAVLCSLAAAGAAEASTSYVALGDSYSAGSGAGTSDLSSSCYRSSKGYPQVVAAQRTDLALTNVTCGGAVTTDVTNNQVPALSSTTGLVTITIGGNDVGFANLILACGSWSYTWCESQIASTNSQIANQLPAKLDATYTAIRNAAPSAQVIVMGYPHLFPTPAKVCSSSVPYSGEETDLDKLADNLDGVIQDRALAHGFTYVDAIKPFTGHEVCSTSPWVWGNSNPYGPYAYHPNATGQASGYAVMVRSVIG